MHCLMNSILQPLLWWSAAAVVEPCHPCYDVPCDMCMQDISQLRKLAAVRGLVNTELRARLWPCLLAGQGASSALAVPTGSAIASHGPYYSRSSSISSLAGQATADPDSNSSKLSDKQYLEWAAGTHKDSMTVGTVCNRHHSWEAATSIHCMHVLHAAHSLLHRGSNRYP